MLPAVLRCAYFIWRIAKLFTQLLLYSPAKQQQMNYYRHFKQSAELLLTKKRRRSAGGTRQVQCAHNLCKLTKTTPQFDKASCSHWPPPNQPQRQTQTSGLVNGYALIATNHFHLTFCFLLTFSFRLHFCAPSPHLHTRSLPFGRVATWSGVKLHGAAPIQQSRRRSIATIIAPTSANLHEYMYVCWRV